MTPNFCPSCGSKADPVDRFCSQCGFRLVRDELESRTESRIMRDIWTGFGIMLGSSAIYGIAVTAWFPADILKLATIIYVLVVLGSLGFFAKAARKARAHGYRIHFYSWPMLERIS